MSDLAARTYLDFNFTTMIWRKMLSVESEKIFSRGFVVIAIIDIWLLHTDCVCMYVCRYLYMQLPDQHPWRLLNLQMGKKTLVIQYISFHENCLFPRT